MGCSWEAHISYMPREHERLLDERLATTLENLHCSATACQVGSTEICKGARVLVMATARMTEEEKELARRLGHNVREARQRARLSPEQLATFARVSVAYVRKIEGGKARSPNVHKLRAIAVVVGYKSDDFYREHLDEPDYSSMPTVFVFVHPAFLPSQEVLDEAALLAKSVAARFRNKIKAPDCNPQ